MDEQDDADGLRELLLLTKARELVAIEAVVFECTYIFQVHPFLINLHQLLLIYNVF